MAFLESENPSTSFGGSLAINTQDSTVEKGEILGVIGPNGSGTTTLFNRISGLLKPDKGRIALENKEIAGASPSSPLRRSICRGSNRMEGGRCSRTGRARGSGRRRTQTSCHCCGKRSAVSGAACFPPSRPPIQKRCLDVPCSDVTLEKDELMALIPAREPGIIPLLLF